MTKKKEVAMRLYGITSVGKSTEGMKIILNKE